VGEETTVNVKKFLVYGAVAVAAYLLYRNVFAADSGSQATDSAGLGGIDFGVLNPSTW
jgi:hypothetical protein